MEWKCERTEGIQPQSSKNRPKSLLPNYGQGDGWGKKIKIKAWNFSKENCRDSSAGGQSSAWEEIVVSDG